MTSKNKIITSFAALSALRPKSTITSEQAINIANLKAQFQMAEFAQLPVFFENIDNYGKSTYVLLESALVQSVNTNQNDALNDIIKKIVSKPKILKYFLSSRNTKISKLVFESALSTFNIEACRILYGTPELKLVWNKCGDDLALYAYGLFEKEHYVQYSVSPLKFLIEETDIISIEGAQKLKKKLDDLYQKKVKNSYMGYTNSRLSMSILDLQKNLDIIATKKQLLQAIPQINISEVKPKTKQKI